MKTINIVVLALIGILAAGCASPSNNPDSAGYGKTTTNTEDAAVMRDIKNGHDSSSPADKQTVPGGAPGSASGPGGSPQ